MSSIFKLVLSPNESRFSYQKIDNQEPAVPAGKFQWAKDPQDLAKSTPKASFICPMNLTAHQYSKTKVLLGGRGGTPVWGEALKSPCCKI